METSEIYKHNSSPGAEITLKDLQVLNLILRV